MRDFDFEFKSSKILKLEHFHRYDEFFDRYDYFNSKSVDFSEDYYSHFVHNCFEG